MAEEISITSDEDVIKVRQKVRQNAQSMGMGTLDQTRLITAVSELARNIVVHAKGGKVRILMSDSGERKGIKVVFEDCGHGIADIKKAMEEGFSTSGSLGIGLMGAKRLVDEFEIDSTVGKGTRVTITKWL